ncbi:MAG TPA: 2-oxo acid dehydrogenase subunit E2 [Fastidiosipila sp.]|nr:2-oxo acid dehydrogenase subunit E2 [Fastidiosipila sp.]
MFEYKFPDIGEGITEGTLAKWLVKEGDEVTEGQDIAEIETDKMTTTLPAAASGKVHKLHVEEQGILHVGKVFITIDDGSASKDESAAKETEKTVKVELDADIPRAKTDEEAGVVGELISSQDELPPSDEGQSEHKTSSDKKKVLATPVARKLAKDLDVDIKEITGSGPGGRIMKEDIRAFADDKKKAGTSPSETPAADTDRREPLSRIRLTIADKMKASQQSLVHTTTLDEVDVSDLVSFREKMKTVVGEDVKLTYLPFVIKAIVLALKAFPVFNSSLDEDRSEIIYKSNYNIGIATDTERGLVVPVLFHADRKSIIEIANETQALALAARENTLTLEHLRGGTFSITNYGAIGGSFGTPIINYPESAILGIGRIQEKPIVKDGRILIGHMLPLSLSFDHRIIDGASGVRFVRFIEETLQKPELLLLSI